MSRHNHGSRRDPYLIPYGRYSEFNSLHEAKLAAWAFAIGEGTPAGRGSGRRFRRGMLSDLPAPEPPPSERRSPFAPWSEVVARLFSFLWPSAHLGELSAKAQGVAVIGTDSPSLDLVDAAMRDEKEPLRSRAA
ncbi:MAG: hypothetical protein M9944_19225 [Rhizobiaceae bacterium]|nr:hypothetical protein [Rhizobiaceae bacterium]